MVKRIVFIILVLLLVGCGSATPNAEQVLAPTAVSTEAVVEDVAESPTEEPTEEPELPESSEIETAVPATEEPNENELSNSALPVLEEPTPTPEPEAPSFAGTIAAPEFPAGLDWLNTGRPLTLAELRGKIVILDFWTYGCINCIHVIPDLKALEEKYAEELVVIGVHSAKFENEGETDNIRQIILRYELEHPVINDKDFIVWSTWGARAWPTFAFIDPVGNVLGFHSGEGVYDLFDQVIEGMIAEFDAQDQIDRTPLELILENEGLAESPLLFPGKVLADAPNNRLFIADSNHNRIVVTDLEGRVLEVIGNGRPDLQDGTFETASFFRPQGLTLADDNTLYVADTSNHAIRRVDLEAGLVETVAGNGRQGRYELFEGVGEMVALNSPWDVLYENGIVYIAMAGQHQLWQYEPSTDIVKVFAGSGREELLDGPLFVGGLNQPSGLATDGEKLYFADSEASAIRTATLSEGAGELDTIVGTGLFDFGDIDGVGDDVRLQHPLGVVYQDNLLYIADTYNNKIKIINPETRESSTLFGTGEDGWQDGSGDVLFDEPGGLSIAGDKLYIADTNNHVIRVADLTTNELSTIVLIDTEGLLTRQSEGAPYSGKVVTLDPQTVASGQIETELVVDVPEGFKLNDIAPFSIDWRANGDDEILVSYQEVAPQFPLQIPLSVDDGITNLQADVVIYYCDDEAESLCFIERLRVQIPIQVEDGGETAVQINYAIPLPVNGEG